MKKLLKYSFVLALLSGIGLSGRPCRAQSVCNSSGETVGPAAEFGPATYAIGDLTIVDGGADPADVNDADWYLAATAHVDLYAALEIPSGTVVRLKAGAVLNLYGNLTNNGYLFIEPGATINFYGNTWTNSTTAIVGDGAAAANTTPGGTVNFIASRPAIPASVSASACVMSNYSGGNFAQNIDGGNVAMDIVLHVQNANNINLINTDTKLEGELVFDVADGDINLGNNDFIFTANGNWTTNLAPNAAYFLTNGTVACAGAVEKEGLAPGATFTFPVGRTETYTGGRDFTPALLRNDGTVTDNFQVRVKSYAEANSVSGVVIPAPQEGMDRAWQITSTFGSGVTMSLQHNTATNGSSYTAVFGGDPNAFITQYQGGGNWSTALPPGNITGSVSGSVVHTQGFSVTTTATSCTDPQSWFTKTPDQVTPLPVELVSFTGKEWNCQALLQWTTAREEGFDKFEVEYSIDAVSYAAIGTRKGNGNGSYSFSYDQHRDKAYYRLRMIDKSGSASYSATVTVTLGCQTPAPLITLFPNPTTGKLKITGVKGAEDIRVYSISGQLIVQQKPLGETAEMDLTPFAAGAYYVVVTRDGNQVYNAKVIRKVE